MDLSATLFSNSQSLRFPQVAKWSTVRDNTADKISALLSRAARAGQDILFAEQGLTVETFADAAISIAKYMQSKSIPVIQDEWARHLEKWW